MLLNKYIIQERIANFTWVDVYENYDKELVDKALKALKDNSRNCFKIYRVVRSCNNV